MNNQDHLPFRGLLSPNVPKDLDQQVLWRANAALRAPRPNPDRWGRIRKSGVWRLAWAASVILLCTANLTLSGWMKIPSARSSQPERFTMDPEINAIVDLPPLRISADQLSNIRGESRTNRPDSEDLS